MLSKDFYHTFMQKKQLKAKQLHPPPPNPSYQVAAAYNITY